MVLYIVGRASSKNWRVSVGFLSNQRLFMQNPLYGLARFAFGGMEVQKGHMLVQQQARTQLPSHLG